MNNYQITLFFKENTKFKNIELSNTLIENIKELGEPILLPNNPTLPKEANFPIIIFNKNKKIHMTGNYQSIIITVNEGNDIEIKDLILKTNNALEKNDIEVIRIGYGFQTELEKELINRFKTSHFIMDELKNSINFELSWLSEININNIKVNCWQRYFTNQNSENLNVIFDINTKAEEKNILDKIFLENFMNESEEFIKNNIYK